MRKSKKEVLASGSHFGFKADAARGATELAQLVYQSQLLHNLVEEQRATNQILRSLLAQAQHATSSSW